MLFDTHTNLLWYPDHLTDEFVESALAAKKAKMRLSPDVYFADDSRDERNAFDATPEQLLAATEDCDGAIVFGLRAPHVGIDVPQELVAGFVNENPDRFFGWGSVNPNDADCIDQLEYCVEDLGATGAEGGPDLPELGSPGSRDICRFSKKRNRWVFR